MICRWSSGHCLKDAVMSGSASMLSGRSVPPPHIFRGTPSRISDWGIRLVPTPATTNSFAAYDERGFLPVFPRRMRKDVLCQNGGFAPLPISPANYHSNFSGTDSPVRHRVMANSSPEGQANGDPSNKSRGLIPKFVGLLTGIIGLLIKLIPRVLLPFWSGEGKGAFLKITEDAKDAAEVVREASEDVKEIAELSEKIAEEVEGKTREDGSIHKTAELVDSFSKEVVKDAAIVENIAEKVEEATKTIDEIVEDVEDFNIPRGGSNAAATSSSGSSDKSLKDSPVQASKFVNSADILPGISEGIVRWLAGLLWACVDVPQKGLRLLGRRIAVLCVVLVSMAAWRGFLPLLLRMPLGIPTQLDNPLNSLFLFSFHGPEA